MDNMHISQDKSDKNERLILILLLFLPCLLIRNGLDNDTWFLLNSGRYVMNHGIPHIEPFSIHENMEFVMQQWLTDVMFWNIYEKFGDNGLILVITVCYSIIIYLMFKLTMKISDNNFFVSYAITMMASILVYTYMVARPTVLTLVIVMVELNLLENWVVEKNNKYLLVLPLLSMLLINLQAALWPILFILIIPYIVESFKYKICNLSDEEYDNRYLLLAVAAMFIFALINPYGIDAMTYLVRSFGYPYMNNIVEIQPPNISDFSGAIIYVYISSIILIYIFYKRGTSKIRYFLLTVGTTYMVLTSIRNITYFAVCSSFPIAYYLKDFKIIKISRLNKVSNYYLRKILIVTIIIIVVYVNYKMGVTRKLNEKDTNLNNTINYILENEDTSKIILYTDFNEGSLVQFRGLKSYIDPRAEIYFKKHNKKDDIFNEYFDMLYGNVYYKDVLDKYNFTHLIVSKGDMLDTYLCKDEEYSVIYKNDEYSLFKRNESISK